LPSSDRIWRLSYRTTLFLDRYQKGKRERDLTNRKKLSTAAYPPDQQEANSQSRAGLKNLLAGNSSNPFETAGKNSS